MMSVCERSGGKNGWGGEMKESEHGLTNHLLGDGAAKQLFKAAVGICL